MHIKKKIKSSFRWGSAIVLAGILLRLFSRTLSKGYVNGAWGTDEEQVARYIDDSWLLIFAGLVFVALSIHRWLWLEDTTNEE